MTTEIERPYTVLKISTDNGPLAQIWLASNMTNISRGSVLQTNIKDSAEEIAKASGCFPNITGTDTEGYITLRTSGELLQGIVRVYAKQAGFLLSDIKDTLTKISSLFKISSGVNVTISKVTAISRIDQLVLEDAVTEEDVLMTPSLDFLNDAFGGGGNLWNDPTRRELHGAATTWDRSIEVGRGVIAQTQVSELAATQQQDASAFDLDFDINGMLSPVDTSAEGTRTNFPPAASRVQGDSTIHNTLLDNAQDDFSLGTTTAPIAQGAGSSIPQDLGSDLGLDLDLNLGENGHNDLGDKSIEMGRRAADSSLLGERTDFGFDLEIEGEYSNANAENQLAKDASNPQLLQLSKQAPKRIKITNSALLNTTELIVDDGIELQQPQLRRIVTNRQEGDLHHLMQGTTRLTQKRVWEEMAREMGFLPSLALNSLVSYQNLKKQRLETVTGEGLENQEPQMDLSLNLDSEVLDTTRYPEESDLGLAGELEHPGLDDGNVQDFSLGSSPYQSSQEENAEPHSDQIQLNTGETAPKRVVDMADVLRGHSNSDSQVTFDSVIREQYGEENPISRTDASKGLLSLLSLASVGCVDLKQSEPFGDINVFTRAPLFERYISV